MHSERNYKLISYKLIKNLKLITPLSLNVLTYIDRPGEDR